MNIPSTIIIVKIKYPLCWVRVSLIEGVPKCWMFIVSVLNLDPSVKSLGRKDWRPTWGVPLFPSLNCLGDFIPLKTSSDVVPLNWIPSPSDPSERTLLQKTLLCTSYSSTRDPLPSTCFDKVVHITGVRPVLFYPLNLLVVSLRVIPISFTLSHTVPHYGVPGLVLQEASRVKVLHPVPLYFPIPVCLVSSPSWYPYCTTLHSKLHKEWSLHRFSISLCHLLFSRQSVDYDIRSTSSYRRTWFHHLHSYLSSNPRIILRLLSSRPTPSTPTPSLVIVTDTIVSLLPMLHWSDLVLV